MEPIFAESASETVTAELRAQLDAAVAALPPAHFLAPTENELSRLLRSSLYTASGLGLYEGLRLCHRVC